MKDYIELLEGQVDLFEHRIATATDSFERGLWTGRRDATNEAIEFAKRIEPEIEEPYTSLRERLMAEEYSMAGDIRDFPADAA